MACAVLLLASSAVEQWFSNCGWGRNDLEYFLSCFPRPGPLFYVSLQASIALLRWGGRVWTPETPFHLSLESLDPRKQRPESGRTSHSARLRPSLGCSDKVRVEKRRGKGGSGESFWPRGISFWGQVLSGFLSRTSVSRP